MSAVALGSGCVGLVPAAATRRGSVRHRARVGCRAAAKRIDDAAPPAYPAMVVLTRAHVKLAAGVSIAAATSLVACAARAEDEASGSDAPAQVTAAATAAVDDAANTATAATTAAAAAVDDAAATAAAAASAAAAAAADTAAAATAAVDNASAALSGALGNAGSTFASLKASAGSALGGASSQAGSAVGGATAGARSALGGAAGSVGTELNAASRAVGDAAGGVADAAGQAASSVSASANQAVSIVTAATAAAAATAADALLRALESVLPPEFAAVVHQAEGDTAVALVATVFALPFALALLAALTRGYAGEQSSFVVDDALRTNPLAFLIDTRDEESRREDGVPDLRDTQRRKAAAVEVVALSKAVRDQVKNPRTLELELAAAQVKALTRRGGTVYVMGPDAAALAKAVTAVGGRRAFVLDGGFDAWRAGGLKVRSNGSYEKSVLDLIGEETSDAAGRFTQRVSTTIGTVRTTVKEADKRPVVAGVVVFAVAAYNYETTLQLAGVIGIEVTILSKILSYDSPGELFGDVKGAVGGVAQALSTLAASVPAAEAPKKLSAPPVMPSVPRAVTAVAPVMQAVVLEEVAAVPIEAAAVAVEAAAGPIEEAAVPIAPEAVPVEAAAAPIEAAAVPIEAAAVPIAPEAVPVEEAAVPIAPEAVSVEVAAVPIEEAAVPIAPEAVLEEVMAEEIVSTAGPVVPEQVMAEEVVPTSPPVAKDGAVLDTTKSKKEAKKSGRAAAKERRIGKEEVAGAGAEAVKQAAAVEVEGVKEPQPEPVKYPPLEEADIELKTDM